MAAFPKQKKIFIDINSATPPKCPPCRTTSCQDGGHIGAEASAGNANIFRRFYLLEGRSGRDHYQDPLRSGRRRANHTPPGRRRPAGAVLPRFRTARRPPRRSPSLMRVKNSNVAESAFAASSVQRAQLADKLFPGGTSVVTSADGPEVSKYCQKIKIIFTSLLYVFITTHNLHNQKSNKIFFNYIYQN